MFNFIANIVNSKLLRQHTHWTPGCETNHNPGVEKLLPRACMSLCVCVFVVVFV